MKFCTYLCNLFVVHVFFVFCMLDTVMCGDVSFIMLSIDALCLTCMSTCMSIDAICLICMHMYA